MTNWSIAREPVRTPSLKSQVKPKLRSSSARQTNPAPPGRKNAAQGARREWTRPDEQAPSGQKKGSHPRPPELRIVPLPMEREVQAGNSLIGLLLEALEHQKQRLRKGDILVIKHKIVSKAEGQFVDLKATKPSAAARRWARRYRLDARVIELAIAQSRRIVRRKRGVLITDTFGRPWREGLTEVAIGVAGMKALHDYRGRRDPHDYTLQASIEADADQLACAAGLVCGKLARTPACIIRGFAYQPGGGTDRDLIRPAANDLFR